MRRAILLAVTAAASIGPVFSGLADGDEVRGKIDTFKVHVRVFDTKLAPQKTATSKVLEDVTCPVIEGRTFDYRSGSVFQFPGQDNKNKPAFSGTLVEGLLAWNKDGSLSIDISLSLTSIATNTDQQLQLNTEKVRLLTNAKLTEPTKVLWKRLGADHERRVELVVERNNQ